MLQAAHDPPTRRKGQDSLASPDIIKTIPSWESNVKDYPLAEEGHQNAIFEFVSDLQRRYPEDPSTNIRHPVFISIYARLAAAGDPRGHVKVAEEFLRQAHFSYRHSDYASMRSELRTSEKYLMEGKPLATGNLLKYISELEFEIIKLENSPTQFHIVSSLIIAAAAFVGNWEREGLERAIDYTIECRRNRPAVDLHPTLRLPFSIFGCYVY